MKNKDKHYLKALLLASVSSIGLPIAQAAGFSTTITRKERDGSDASTEIVSETMSSGVLESHPSFGEVMGHTSHSSHGSHGSHGSHTSSSHGSHSSSSYGGGSGGSGNSTNIGLTALGIVGTVAVSYGLPYLIHHIIKTHKNHIASRKAEMNRSFYASRDLSSGIYGNDVDRMTDLLIDNDVLVGYDRTFSHKWSHYKYDRKVKRSVKRMQARMGQKKTGKASTIFLADLKQWKKTRQRLVNSVTKDSLDITEDRNALMAVAILLVEKGYLKSYDADDIMSEHEKSKIVRAYYTFLRDKRLPETSLIDERKMNLLNYSPNKQK